MTAGLFGRVMAVMAIIVAAPLMLVLAVVTLLSLGSPVLFRQRRAGVGGASFEMVKFRTMRDIRDGGGKPLPDEERLLPLGRFIRRTRMDELPELWNIIRHEMNWVGPRPLLPETIQAYGGPGEKRGSVLPGLTGWAQINGNSLLTAEDKLQLDLWYIENRNWRLDLAILLRTVLVVVSGERINRAKLEK